MVRLGNSILLFVDLEAASPPTLPLASDALVKHSTLVLKCLNNAFLDGKTSLQNLQDTLFVDVEVGGDEDATSSLVVDVVPGVLDVVATTCCFFILL